METVQLYRSKYSQQVLIPVKLAKHLKELPNNLNLILKLIFFSVAIEQKHDQGVESVGRHAAGLSSKK